MTGRWIAFVFVVGCSQPAVLVTPGQVVVAGDTTFRTHEHDTIDVTTRRLFEDVSGTGSVRLHGLDLDTAKRSIWVRIAGARAWLAIASQLEPQRAYAACRRGLDELGSMFDLPRKPMIMDDTGNYIHIADDLASRSDFKPAADELVKVIQTRIVIYVKKAAGTAE